MFHIKVVHFDWITGDLIVFTCVNFAQWTQHQQEHLLPKKPRFMHTVNGSLARDAWAIISASEFVQLK